MKIKDEARKVCPICEKKLVEDKLNDYMTFMSCKDCNAIFDYYCTERRKTAKKVANERRR